MSKKIFGFYEGPVKAWQDSSDSDSSGDDDNLNSPDAKSTIKEDNTTNNNDKKNRISFDSDDSDSDDDGIDINNSEIEARKKAAEEKLAQLLGESITTTSPPPPSSSSSSKSNKNNNNKTNTNTATTGRIGRRRKVARTNNNDSVINLNSDEDDNNDDHDSNNSDEDDDDDDLENNPLSAKLKQLEELRRKADTQVVSYAASTSRNNVKRKAIEITAVKSSAERANEEKNFIGQYLKQFDGVAAVEIDKSDVNNAYNMSSAQASSSSAIVVDVDHVNGNAESSTGGRANSDTSNNVNIKTRLNGHHEWRWNIKKDDKLKKLRDKFCEIYGVSMHQVNIEFDGEEIGDNDTPEGLDMEDDDLIDCSVAKELYDCAIASAESVKSGTTVPPPALPAPEPVITNGINLKTRLNGQHEWRWNIKKEDKLKKLRDKYCEIYNVNIHQVVIEFDGEEIGDNDTPEGLDMEDDDLIDCKIPKHLYNDAVSAAEGVKSGKRKLAPVANTAPSSTKTKSVTTTKTVTSPSSSSSSSSRTASVPMHMSMPMPNVDPNDTCHLKIEFIFGNPEVFEVKVKNEFVLGTILSRVLQSPNLTGKFSNNQLLPNQNCCVWIGNCVISDINQSVTSLKRQIPHFNGYVYIIPTTGFGTKTPVLLIDHSSNLRTSICLINPRAKTLSGLFSQAKTKLSSSYPSGFNLFASNNSTRPLRQSYDIANNFNTNVPVIIVKNI